MTTDRQIEAVARAIYQVSPAYYSGTTIPVPYEEAAPPYKDDVIREAKAAIAASDAKYVPMLVEALKAVFDEDDCNVHDMRAYVKTALAQLPPELRSE